jgi:tryptophan synthase beta chain
MRYTLSPNEIPTTWFNVASHLPWAQRLPLHPVHERPIEGEDLVTLFPAALIEQEMSTVPWVDIPGEVLDVLRLWRPTPLVRATRLEQALRTPARIYFKDESVSPAGSHKSNTAVAQAYYNKAEGGHRVTTETGAGQWGCAMAMACQLFDLECRVFMVSASYHQKPYRRTLMEVWGAQVLASPSTYTAAGQSILNSAPESSGSLGIAISEAVEEAMRLPDTHYAAGSVLNHVLLHQTIIGLEAELQLQLAGERRPDVIIGSCGGGSNLAGLATPFLQADEDARPHIVAIEPRSCPSLTAGQLRYESGDTVGLTPRPWMYSLQRDFIPPPTHTAGLSYHGAAPIVSGLLEQGWMDAIAYPQQKAFDAAVLFARTQGMIPAPEAAHAIRGVVDTALAAKAAKQEPVILFNFSGHGLLDMSAYFDYQHDLLVEE